MNVNEKSGYSSLGTKVRENDAMAKFPREDRPELAILPLGTANDFATACQIPSDSLEALRTSQKQLYPFCGDHF